MVDVRDKWNLRYLDANVAGARPARVLSDNLHLLPDQGEALDVACGLGGNSILLASRGIAARAWDVSDVAIAKLNQFAQSRGLRISASVRDVEREPPPANGFDVIVVTRFLVRGLAPALMEALRPGGLLLYQTFVRESLPDACGPTTAAYRLEVNELLRLFSSLRVVGYREEGLIGNLREGFRNEAMFIGQKINASA